MHHVREIPTECQRNDKGREKSPANMWGVTSFVQEWKLTGCVLVTPGLYVTFADGSSGEIVKLLVPPVKGLRAGVSCKGLPMTHVCIYVL